MIEKKVAEAREFFNIKDYPGNFFGLITENNFIEKFGLLIFKENIGKTSGFIGYADDLTPIICINNRRPIGHQNFTLAHEVGHYFLHKGIVNCDSDEDIFSRVGLENDANEFAAELLYPRKFVLRDITYIKKNNLFAVKNNLKLADYINDLCKKYFISFKAAFYRIMFTYEYQRSIRNRYYAITKEVGKLSERYEDYMHIVVPDHPFYVPYTFPLELMGQYVAELIELEEISYETGHAITERNKQLGV